MKLGKIEKMEDRSHLTLKTFQNLLLGLLKLSSEFFSNFVEGTKPSREVTTSVCSLNKEKSKHPLDLMNSKRNIHNSIVRIRRRKLYGRRFAK